MTRLMYIAVILVSYLIGCSNMALYISKYKGVDIRAKGSGNLGASNALVTMGWPAGVAVALHDIGKAVLAVVLAKHFCPQLPLIGAIAGVSCVLGHIFPFYLRFKGGKGLASFLGMTLALNWKFALVVFVLVALITLITDYIAVATLTTIVLVPGYMGIMYQSLSLVLILCVATVVILLKHRENLVRLCNGTEIGFRRANRGDDREN